MGQTFAALYGEHQRFSGLGFHVVDEDRVARGRNAFRHKFTPTFVGPIRPLYRALDLGVTYLALSHTLAGMGVYAHMLVALLF